MTLNNFLARLKEEILETELEISLDTKLSEIEEWDSLSFVSFIALCKEAGAKNVDSKAISGAETVGDLFNLVNDK